MQIALEGAQRSIREHEKFIFVLIRMLNDRALPVARPDSVTKSGVEPTCPLPFAICQLQWYN